MNKRASALVIGGIVVGVIVLLVIFGSVARSGSRNSDSGNSACGNQQDSSDLSSWCNKQNQAIETEEAVRKSGALSAYTTVIGVEEFQGDSTCHVQQIGMAGIFAGKVMADYYFLDKNRETFWMTNHLLKNSPSGKCTDYGAKFVEGNPIVCDDYEID